MALKGLRLPGGALEERAGLLWAFPGGTGMSYVEMGTGVGGKCLPRGMGCLLEAYAGHGVSRCEWRAGSEDTGLFPDTAVHSGLAHVGCGKALGEDDVQALTLGHSTWLNWPPDALPPACAVTEVTFTSP